jgi:hypothetical protein
MDARGRWRDSEEGKSIGVIEIKVRANDRERRCPVECIAHGKIPEPLAGLTRILVI